ncbi:MAG: nucleoside hydrolase [Chloroflexota bacterium]
MTTMSQFPTLSEEYYRHILRLPEGPVRCVIDTDTRNEIDDQFALAWALQSRDELNIEAIYAAPYSFRNRMDELREADAILKRDPNSTASVVQRYRGQLVRLQARGTDISSDAALDPQGVTMVDAGTGMEKSYEEILIVMDRMGLTGTIDVLRGSTRYLGSYDTPVESAAVEHMIAAARTATPDDPLYIVAIGAVTNVASALLLAPEIIENIVVTWTAGYPTSIMNVFQESFNMEQDMLASQLLFDSGVPMVYLPGFHVGAQLGISLPEMEAWVKGKGAIGDYLYELYTDNPHYPFQGIDTDDHFGRSWIIWDFVNFAWLMHPEWMPSLMVDAPYLTDDRKWIRKDTPRHLMREGLDINRTAIYRDFFQKLAANS